jgi:Zn-dependent membrane protease YugP
VGPEEAAACSFLVLILFVIGFIAKIAILWTIGIILLIVGAVLWMLGSMGRPVGVCARSPPREPARTSGARC